MHKFNKGDICIFTNMSITEIRENDGKSVRITKLLADAENEKGPLYEIEFLDKDLCFGAREKELKLMCKAAFPRLCPRCWGNIGVCGIDYGQKITRCPFCLFEIRRI